MYTSRVAILVADAPNLNGDIYPRDVVERAINLWDGQMLAIVHADYRPCVHDPPRLADAVGVASHIHLDEFTNQVIADVKFKLTPEMLTGCTFEPEGEIICVGTDATDFKMTGLVIAPGKPENDND